MLRQLLIVLLPAMVMANVTTTIELWDFFTNRTWNPRPSLGFRGSVINVDASETTALLGYDPDTDFGSFKINPSRSFTAILAPSSVSAQITNWITTGMECTRPATATAPTCTVYHDGPGANSINCWRGRPTTGRYSTFSPNVELFKTWCSQASTVPDELARFTYTLDSSEILQYRVVLTDGLEKLNVAAPTTTASGSEGIASPTTAASATAGAPQATSGSQLTRALVCALAVLGSR